MKNNTDQAHALADRCWALREKLSRTSDDKAANREIVDVLGDACSMLHALARATGK